MLKKFPLWVIKLILSCLCLLVSQEEQVDVNFIKSNNFNNNAYRNNFGNNKYMPYPSNNGNSYGNSYSNNRSAPSDLEVMLKDFINKQTAFNKSVEEKLGKNWCSCF